VIRLPSFTHNLNIIARCTQMSREQRLSELGIHGGQVPYLLRLCRCPGLSQEEIARALYVNKSTAARQLSSLEQDGYAERRPSEQDRRMLLIYPTEAAVSILLRLREIIRSWNDYLLEDFTEEERVLLQSMMERVSLRARSCIEREMGWDN